MFFILKVHGGRSSIAYLRIQPTLINIKDGELDFQPWRGVVDKTFCDKVI